MKKIHIAGVIFDYGNVLCHPQESAAVEGMAKAIGLPLERFQQLYWKFRLPYDRGDFTGDTYWSTVLAEEGRQADAALVQQLVALDIASWARENEGTIRWVEQLHEAGLPLALLSNMPGELSKGLHAGGTWPRFFNHCVFSCDLRRNKPDPEIYQACLQALGVPAEQVLFLDDIPANVHAAARLGIHGVVFDTLEKTQARVAEKFDIPVALAAAQSVSR